MSDTDVNVLQPPTKSPLFYMAWSDAQTQAIYFNSSAQCFAILTRPYLICYIHPAFFTTIVWGRRRGRRQVDFYVWKISIKKLHRWEQWDWSVLQLFLSSVSNISTSQALSSIDFHL